MHWKNFKNLKVNASLDGSHKRAEYWRKNTDWETVVDNRRKMIEQCPNTEFKVSFTLSWVNSYNLPDFHKEWVHLKLIKASDLSLNLLDRPHFYSIKNIPDWKKKKIEILFRDHIEWLKLEPNTTRVIKEFSDAINFMYSVDTNDDFIGKEEFFSITEKLDTMRKENFYSVFPEHIDMLQCKGQ